MPYSNLAELPTYVKKLSRKKRRKWMAVFNSVFAKNGEAAAFKAANSAVKESATAEGGNDMKNGLRNFDHVVDLIEAIGSASLDKENGVIRDVVILTGEKVSRNKTFYTKKALEEAVKRYEGAKMFLDHPRSDEGAVRSVRDLGGTYRNVRITEGRFLRGDLHLLPNPEIRDIVIPIAESKPTGVGLSIRDRGKGRDKDGVFLVEGFAPTGPYSIDLVTEASVNENLFESIEEDTDMKIEDIKLDDLQEGNPALVEAIRKEARDAVMKELEEKIKKGEEADKVILEAKKGKILAEAGLPKEVADKVKALIESESVTLELAESIVVSHKEIVASIKGGSTKDPKVNGHGGERKKELEEAELPTAEKLAEAIHKA